MMNVIIFFLTVIFGSFLGSTVLYNIRVHDRKIKDGFAEREIDELQTELINSKEQVRFWVEEYKTILEKYSDVQRAYYELARYQSRHQEKEVDTDIADAIKFAMSCSHPDKPTGDAEKFRKYFDLYKKYCK